MAKHGEGVWGRFNAKRQRRQPRELLLNALKYVDARDEALDLGPGPLNESRHLLDIGFKKVTAVNIEPPSTDPVVQSIVDSLPADRFTYVVSSFDSFSFPNERYDIVNAQYSLPFSRPETFERVFASVLASLKRGGIVTGQFFGVNDEWRTSSGITFIDRSTAERLLSQCEIIYFHEQEGDEPLVRGGTRHAHIFHFIARKK